MSDFAVRWAARTDPISGRLVMGDGTGKSLVFSKRTGAGAFTDVFAFRDDGKLTLGALQVTGLSVAGVVHNDGSGNLLTGLIGTADMGVGGADNLLKTNSANNAVVWGKLVGANVTARTLTADKLDAGGTAKRLMRTDNGTDAVWGQLDNADVADGTITLAKLNASSATSGQFAVYSGSVWAAFTLTLAGLGGVPTGRTVTGTSPIRINGGASSTFAADFTVSILDATNAALGAVQLQDDLGGTDGLHPKVVGITGASGTANVHAANLLFDGGITPIIGQADVSLDAIAGPTFTFHAANNVHAGTGIGADLVLASGTGTLVAGAAAIRTGDSSAMLKLLPGGPAGTAELTVTELDFLAPSGAILVTRPAVSGTGAGFNWYGQDSSSVAGVGGPVDFRSGNGDGGAGDFQIGIGDGTVRLKMYGIGVVGDFQVDWKVNFVELLNAGGDVRIRLTPITSNDASGSALQLLGQDVAGTNTIGGAAVLGGGSGTSHHGPVKLRRGGADKFVIDDWSSGRDVVFLVNGVAPSGNPSGGAYLWAEPGDGGGNPAALKCRLADGTVKTLAP